MSVNTLSWIGQILANRYQVVRLLGEGGMGFVYLTKDAQSGGEGVIKVPRPSMLEDANFAGRFLREVRTLVQLTHPHIVKVRDVNEHEGVPFLVLEYLSGGNLRRRLPQGLTDITGWLPDLASALDFVHQSGYVHRDVKPDNILFDEQGRVYLSDFGIIKATAEPTTPSKQTVLTSTGMVLGTVQYMAPELLLGEKYDRRVDQWALGVMLYEILGHRLPFEASTAAALVLKQLNEHPPRLDEMVPEVPAGVAAAVRRALSRRPEQRFHSCSELAQEVVAAARSQPVPLARATQPHGITASPPSEPPSSEPASHDGLQRVICTHCGKRLKFAGVPKSGQVRCSRCAGMVPVGPVMGLPESATRSQASADTPHTPIARPVMVSATVVESEEEVISPGPQWWLLIPLLTGGLVLGVVLCALVLWWAFTPAGPVTTTAPPPPIEQGTRLTFTGVDQKGRPTAGVKDALRMEDGWDARRRNCHARMYTIQLKAGDTYLIDAISLVSANQLDPILRVENAAGRELVVDDDSAGYPNSRVLFVPPETADYRLIVSTFKERQTGAFELQISTATPAREIVNSLGTTLVPLYHNRFMMGSSDRELGRKVNEGPVHWVTLTRDFYLGKYEVTVGEFRQFVTATAHVTEAEKDDKGGVGYEAERKAFGTGKGKYSWRWTGWTQDDSHPVVNVTWNDAQAFCTWLSQKEGRVYRLPTEAEWEYACRAQTATAFSFGDDPAKLIEVGNIADASLRRVLPKILEGIAADDHYSFTAPIGQFKANPWGLYDMHGNVNEWCHDSPAEYTNQNRTDPTGAPQGNDRICRGGSWTDPTSWCRSAARITYHHTTRGSGIGFRVACNVD